MLQTAAAAAGVAAFLLGATVAQRAACADTTAAAATFSGSSARASFGLSHLPSVLGRVSPLRETAASLRISIDFALAPRDADQIQPLLDNLYDPGSPDYGHYLTQAEYRSRFSPSQEQIDAVTAFAAAHGLTVTHVSPSGLVIGATGTAAQMDAAFGITLHDYVSPDPRDKGRIFHAPDREPTVAASVAPLLTGILGLSNASAPRSDLRKPTHRTGISGRGTPPPHAPLMVAAQKSDAIVKGSGTGTVTGTVYDYNDNPLAGATVQLVNVSNSGSSPATVTANSSGNFQISNIAAGTYDLYSYTTSYNASQGYDSQDNPIDTVSVTSGSSTHVLFLDYISLDSSDIKSIYGLTSALQNYSGQNQVLGLIEFDTYSSSDITTFEQQYNLTSSYPIITNLSVDGASTTSAPYEQDAADEVTLDIDMMLDLSYNAKQIRVYEAPAEAAETSASSFSQELTDIFDAMANDSTPPSVISCSWGQSEDTISQAEASSENTALQQLALQGQTVCSASGDEGAYDDATSNHTPNVDDPGSHQTIVCVGGTDLYAAFTHSTDTGSLTSQSTWWDPNPTNEQPPIGYGGGGGISVFWSIPTWQQGSFNTSANTQGSTTMRNTPDVSLYASSDYGGYNIYVANEGGYEPVAGTSCAAPLWAAMIADANVARLAAGKTVLGAALPEIYSVAESSSYGTDFYDVKDQSTNGFYTAVTGYDNATGWGTPANGTHLLSDLAAAGSSSSTGASTRFDFNKDGHADLIWYNTGSGDVSVWDMNDQSVLAYGNTFAQLAPSSGWQPVAAPDPNGDGYPDLLWWNSQTGAMSVWTLSNTTVTNYGNTFATIADTTWKPVAAADVTGTTWELVFQNSSSGNISVWQMNGQTVTSYGGVLGSLGANSPWQVVGAPDIDGDGHSDLLFWNSSTGEVTWWGCNLQNQQVLSYNGDFAQVGAPWRLVGSEDTNGDGHPDLIWWNSQTGVESRWLLNGTTVTDYGTTTTQVGDTTWQPTAIR